MDAAEELDIEVYLANFLGCTAKCCVGLVQFT